MAQVTTEPRRFMPEVKDLEGKCAIITGGTTGIGRATANLLASKGMKLLIYGRHEEQLQDALEDMKETGGDVYGMLADNAYEDQILKVFQEAKERFGKLDVLINNAALGAGSVLDTEYEDMLYVIRTNLLGYLTCTREAVKMMRQNGAGHIVNIGSMSAKVMEEESDIYVATKAGIEASTESLNKVLIKENIKLSLIEPGLVGTNLAGEPPNVEAQVQMQAEGKSLEAEDIAYAVYYVLTQPDRSNIKLLRIIPMQQAI